MRVSASGEPIVKPTKDMVLGCYYLTALKEGAKGEGMVFSSLGEHIQSIIAASLIGERTVVS